MASRFASISDEEVKEFTERLENENTKKKTLYDIKVFIEYLDSTKPLLAACEIFLCKTKSYSRGGI